jgi:hypothetical protein
MATTHNPHPLSVTSTTTGSDVEHTMTGDIDAVQAEIDKLFDRYHPAGYGTHITRDNTTESGIRRVVITRYASCD